MGDKAITPISLLRRCVIWCSCVNLVLSIGCSFVTMYLFPMFFQAVRNASPRANSVDMLPQTVIYIVVAIISGGLGMS